MQVAIQAATAVVKVIRETHLTTDPHIRRNSPEEPHRPKQVRPILSQLAFNWKIPDRYVELLNFKIWMENILQMKMYDLDDERKVPIMKKWLDWEGLQLIQTLTSTEKDTCRNAIWLFNVLKEKFRLHHNKMILSLQHCKLHRKDNESSQEWMGRLHIKAAGCNYKEHSRRLKEPFINSIYEYIWWRNCGRDDKRTNDPKEYTRKTVSRY